MQKRRCLLLSYKYIYVSKYFACGENIDIRYTNHTFSILRMSHSQISPAILYWGTPVVIISTENEDGTYNLGPMSSAFWLGDRCILGLLSSSQTTINLLRTKQCVLNLPSDDLTANVNGLARTTGTKDIPDFKQMLGYEYVKDKFAAAKLTPQASEIVRPPRIKECPVQMEAELVIANDLRPYGPAPGFGLVIEVRVLKTYVTDDLRLEGHSNRIDPDAWRPLIMSFQQLYGLRDGKRAKSTLANIDEELYRH